MSKWFFRFIKQIISSGFTPNNLTKIKFFFCYWKSMFLSMVRQKKLATTMKCTNRRRIRIYDKLPFIKRNGNRIKFKRTII